MSEAEGERRPAGAEEARERERDERRDGNQKQDWTAECEELKEEEGVVGPASERGTDNVACDPGTSLTVRVCDAETDTHAAQRQQRQQSVSR